MKNQLYFIHNMWLISESAIRLLILSYSWGIITKRVAFDQKNIGKPIFSYVIGENVLIYQKKCYLNTNSLTNFFFKFFGVYRLNGWILHKIPIAT